MESVIPPFRKVRSTRAQDLIVEQLQEQILGGRYPPGSRLPSERAMMVTFGVSRPTVREALRVAENMGLIAVRHGDPGGPRVLGTPSLGLSNLVNGLLRNARTTRLEVLELRILLDAASTSLACAQPASRLAAAQEILERMRATSDVDDFAQLDVSFHKSLMVAGGSALFALVADSVEETMRGLVENYLDEERSSQVYARMTGDILRQHEEILATIRGGDSRMAARLMREHLRQTFWSYLDDPERSALQKFLEGMG